MFCATHSLCGRPSSHIAGLAVRLSYRPVRAPNSKTRRYRTTRIGVNVPRGRRNRCQFSDKKVKGEADGRTVCWHWADIVFFYFYFDIFIDYFFSESHVLCTHATGWLLLVCIHVAVCLSWYNADGARRRTLQGSARPSHCQPLMQWTLPSAGGYWIIAEKFGGGG